MFTLKQISGELFLNTVRRHVTVQLDLTLHASDGIVSRTQFLWIRSVIFFYMLITFALGSVRTVPTTIFKASSKVKIDAMTNISVLLDFDLVTKT